MILRSKFSDRRSLSMLWAYEKLWSATPTFMIFRIFESFMMFIHFKTSPFDILIIWKDNFLVCTFKMIEYASICHTDNIWVFACRQSGVNFEQLD